MKAFFCYCAYGTASIGTYDYVCYAENEIEATNKFKQFLKDYLGAIPEGIYIARDITALVRSLK